jgi:hypothetical protein
VLGNGNGLPALGDTDAANYFLIEARGRVEDGNGRTLHGIAFGMLS